MLRKNKLEPSPTADGGLDNLLDDKGDDARSRIARRVGQQLSLNDLSETDRRAAETLARELVCDVIERVRAALSNAVRHAKYLPRDVALRIVHDVDSIACPFLEATGIFSHDDWQNLLATISQSPRDR